MNIQATTSSSALSSLNPLPNSVEQSRAAEQAFQARNEQAAQRKAEEEAKPKPVTNSLGQTVGTLINITA